MRFRQYIYIYMHNKCINYRYGFIYCCIMMIYDAFVLWGCVITTNHMHKRPQLPDGLCLRAARRSLAFVILHHLRDFYTSIAGEICPGTLPWPQTIFQVSHHHHLHGVRHFSVSQTAPPLCVVFMTDAGNALQLGHLAVSLDKIVQPENDVTCA
jgi:hypothetical protein